MYDFRTMYFDLVDASQDLVCRVSDLLAERDDLKRRLAESEAGAAAMLNALELIQRAARESNSEERFGEAVTESLETVHTACTPDCGREFLAAARKCRDSLKSYPGRAMVGETEHYNWVADYKESLAAIEPFLGGA